MGRETGTKREGASWGRTLRLAAGGTVVAALAIGIVPLVRPSGLASAAPAAPAASGPAPWDEGRPGALLLHLNSQPLDVALEAPRRRVIVLNAWDRHYIADIRAHNPQATILVYQDMSSTRSYAGAVDGGQDAALLPTGVGYVEAESTDPSWFLVDGAGQRMEWGAYPGHWQMDTGNPAYQQRWLENVRARLDADGWDGVFMDNALTDADAYHSGTVSPLYPNDAAMQAATRSMLSAVGPALRGAGYQVAANISASRLYPGLLADWLQFLDGALEEFWVNWNYTVGGPYVPDWGATGWKDIVDEITVAESMGRWLAVRTPGNSDDRQALLYGLGSYLLANGGRSTFAFTGHDAYSAATSWDPELTWDLGAATGGYYQIDHKLYRRDFVDGVVIVNASDSATRTVALGSSYLDPDEATVDQVTLGPTRATILRSVAGAPATTPDPPAEESGAGSSSPPATTPPPSTTPPAASAGVLYPLQYFQIFGVTFYLVPG